MIQCEKCGAIIPSADVKYRLEVDGRRRMYCADHAKEIIEAQKAAKAPGKSG